MVYKAYAKVNIFLKIVGKRENYHELVSRFMLVKNLYDDMEFVPKNSEEEFELIGDFGCELEQNTIYKAYIALCEAGYEKELKEFFQTEALQVEKRIPSFAGLGGGSSDAACFLKMVNHKLSLHVDTQELAKIGLKVGADVPFFVYGYESANVSGIGEVIEKFDEKALSIKTFTPLVECDTAKVYRAFREEYQEESELAQTMKEMASIELLKSYDDITLNDLFGASLKVYPELEGYRKDGWFFSGSGSSFFKVEK